MCCEKGHQIAHVALGQLGPSEARVPDAPVHRGSVAPQLGREDGGCERLAPPPQARAPGGPLAPRSVTGRAAPSGEQDLSHAGRAPRLRVEGDPVAAGVDEVQADLLADTQEQGIALERPEIALVEDGMEPPILVVHPQALLEDHAREGVPRVHQDLVRAHAVVPPDPLMLSFLDLRGVGRHLGQRPRSAEVHLLDAGTAAGGHRHVVDQLARQPKLRDAQIEHSRRDRLHLVHDRLQPE